jgi:hypothetical protein
MTNDFDVSKLDPNVLKAIAKDLLENGHWCFSTIADELTDGQGGIYYSLLDHLYPETTIPSHMSYFEWRSWQCLHMAEFIRAQR